MTRTVKKPEERRQEIIAAARVLFQTKEYDQTTMQDVMDALGIAKGTIYYYFKSKEELLEAVIEDLVDTNTAHMQKVVDEASGSALEKFRLLVTTGNMEEDNEQILEQLHRPGNMGMHARALAVAVQKQAPLYAQLVQQGCEEGVFHTDTPLETSEFFLAAIQFLTDQGFYPWTSETLMRRATAMPLLIERLLNAPAGSFQFLVPQFPKE